MSYGGIGYNSGTYGGGSVTTPGASVRGGNGPSRNALRNVVDFYALMPLRDEDGAQLGNSFILTATSIPCSVQPYPITRDGLGQASTDEVTPYDIMFGLNPGAVIGDKFDWIDDAGVLREIIVTGTRNMAGRGNAWLATGVEHYQATS